MAIDYWINTTLDRPIRGLGVVDTPESIPADEKFLGGGEEVIPVVEEGIMDLEPTPVVIDSEIIVGEAVVVDPVPIDPVAAV